MIFNALYYYTNNNNNFCWSKVKKYFFKNFQIIYFYKNIQIQKTLSAKMNQAILFMNHITTFCVFISLKNIKIY